MTIAESMRVEFTHEAAVTRKFFDRLPQDKFDWKPHTKSMSLIGLASHLAEIPKWTQLIVTADEFNIPENYKQTIHGNVPALLQAFDHNVEACREALADVGDDAMTRNWRLLFHGSEVFNLPRLVVVRSMVLSHTIHHRGQLSLYLRLLDVPVPAAYGPSADE